MKNEHQSTRLQWYFSFLFFFFLIFFFSHKTISFIDLKQSTSQVINYGTSKKKINTNPNVTAALRVLCVSP